LLLNGLRRSFSRDVAAVATAVCGAWLLWSPLNEMSTLSWWYDRVEYGRSAGELPDPDYNLATLPWRQANPRLFDLTADGLAIVSSGDAFGYQAFAAVDTNGARAADIQFDAEIESGGVSIGLVQGNTWLATSSSQRPGRFADTNSAQLGYGRSVMVIIANNNPSGETRLRIKSLRLYLRR
jgi:hypothetical protein